MRTLLLLLILISFPLLSIESDNEPAHRIWELKVQKKSKDTMTFEELEEIQYFMKRNDLYEVWIKRPEASKWKRYWRSFPKCSCEVHQILQ